MDTRILGSGLVAAALSVAPAFGGPILLPFPEGDAGYAALSNNGALEQGTVEGRIGNRLDTGTYELAIWRRVNVGPLLNLGQLTWGNGVAAPFTLTYDGLTTVTYTLGTKTILSTQIGGTFTDIFIRARSAPTGNVFLTGMQMVGSVAIPNVASIGGGPVNYLRVSNQGQAFGAFTLTGFEAISWIVNEPPANSAVSAQFRLVNVPGPGVAVVVAAAVPLFAVRRRRRAN